MKKKHIGDGGSFQAAVLNSEKTVAELLESMDTSMGTFYRLYKKEEWTNEEKQSAAKALGRTVEDIFGGSDTTPVKPSGADLRQKKAFTSKEDDDPGLIYVPIAAQAGYTRSYLDPQFLSTMERLYIPNSPYKGDNYRYFDVEGDSMYPTIEDGMQVIAEKREPEYWDSLANYYIHVIVLDGMILIKRIYRATREQGVIYLLSDNEMYPQMRVPLSEIKEIWIVKRVLSWKMPPPKTFTVNEQIE